MEEDGKLLLNAAMTHAFNKKSKVYMTSQFSTRTVVNCFCEKKFANRLKIIIF